MRDIYEVPAAAILLKAHKELERLVGTIHQNQFKPELDRKWAYLVYAGLWWEPLREDIEAYISHVNERVTGHDRAEAVQGLGARGHARVATNAVYDMQLATFAESGGLFSQSASPGFIEIWSLQSRMARRVRASRRVGSGHVLSTARPARLEGPQGLPAPEVRPVLPPEAACSPAARSRSRSR